MNINRLDINNKNNVYTDTRSINNAINKAVIMQELWPGDKIDIIVKPGKYTETIKIGNSFELNKNE